MEFLLNEEQTLLKDSVSKYFSDNYDFRARQGIASDSLGYSVDHWSKYAEFGWLSLPFDESIGGFGGRIEDTAIICEQMGRYLALEPFLPNVVMAGSLLARGGHEALISPLVDGRAQFAFAGVERQGRQDVLDVATSATKDGNFFLLNGNKTLVLNGMAARYIVLSARTSGENRQRAGVSLFVIDTQESEMERSEISLMDGSKVANVQFENLRLASESVIGEVGEGATLLEAMVCEARIAIGAEMVGIIDVLREKTIEYTQTRKQFGVAISSFQALQHRMVEMFIATEQSRSILYRAICEYQQEEPAASSTIVAMKAFIGQKARLIGEEAIQLHGGMGMTDELDIGHYVKRLMVLNHMFGDIDANYKSFCMTHYNDAG